MLGERLFWGKGLAKLPGVVQHIYTMAVVLVGWGLFASENMGQLGRYLAVCFGGGKLIDAFTLYQLTSYLPLLVILAFAATPVSGKLFRKLPDRVQAVATPVLVLASLILCTASLVDASYNPFLYFRF